MTTIKTQDLTGAALDWAVAEAVGFKVEIRAESPCKVHDNGGVWLQPTARRPYMPSTDWSQGGPLIERYWLMIDVDYDGETEAKAYLEDGSHWTCFGPTPLVAVCRAIVGVHAKSYEVDVPEELV